MTAAGAVFETRHRAKDTLGYHRHGFSYAAIVLGGAYVEVHDGMPQSCSRGSTVVHLAGEEHADRFADDTLCLNVELPQAVAAKAADGVFDARACPPEALDDLVRAFYRGDGRQLGQSVVRMQALLTSEPPAAAPQPDWLAAALDIFAWCDGAPLRDAARAAGVHQTHFSRAFHQHVGMTPNAYRRRARSRLASRLLLQSSLSLTRIALQCGFSDQSHLTRTFVAEIGVSPGAYRRVFAR